MSSPLERFGDSNSWDSSSDSDYECVAQSARKPPKATSDGKNTLRERVTSFEGNFMNFARPNMSL